MKTLCLVSLAVLLLATGASAQQGSSELRGVVLDGQNAVLPGATLTIRNQDTGTFRETVSNADGAYFVTGLVPGVYEVRALENTRLSIDQRLAIAAKLRVQP